MIRLIILICLLAALIAAVVFRSHYPVSARPLVQRLNIMKTVEDRLVQYGPAARGRVVPFFAVKGVPYPPSRVVLLGLKQENVLEMYAAGTNQPLRFIRAYAILGASGELGPKLRERDRQVPEGIYSIESLNPNSQFHLALRVGYPNAFEQEQAQREGRDHLGGDIMIHGDSVSLGCLAMGDETVEDLFVLAADTGLENISVILSPLDFRLGKTVPSSVKLPAWSKPLYKTIQAQLKELHRDR